MWCIGEGLIMSKHQEIICVTAPIRTEGYLPLTGKNLFILQIWSDAMLRKNMPYANVKRSCNNGICISLKTTFSEVLKGVTRKNACYGPSIHTTNTFYNCLMGMNINSKGLKIFTAAKIYIILRLLRHMPICQRMEISQIIKHHRSKKSLKAC